MKRILVILAFTAFLLSQQAEITNVQVAQRTDGSKLVDITYDLTEDALFTDLQTKYVVAIDGVIPSTGSVTAVVYIATDRDLYKGAYIPGSACTSFDCWQFSDVTPTGVYDDFSAIAVEPTDEDHVWVAFGNCIQESNGIQTCNVIQKQYTIS